MNKNFLFVLLSFLTLFVFASFVHAESSVVESPAIKIVIDGKAGTYESVPILVKDRTLLPLREVLVNLGVMNDEEHIIWNGDEKSVTVNKDSIKIYLKINSDTAYINDEPILLDISPIIYRNRTYIPVRFISQTLGKKVSWNGNTNTVAICDQEVFERVNDAIVKSDVALNAVRFKSTFNMDLDLGGIVKSAATLEGEQDPERKIEHSITRRNESGIEQVVEAYKVNEVGYEKKGTNGKWIKVTGDTDSAVELNIPSDELESIAAGLVYSENETDDEIILEGDIGIITVLNSKTDPEYKVHTIIRLDRTAYLVKEISFDTSGKAVLNGEKLPYTMKATCEFYDFNGDFEIEVPADLPV